MRVDAEKRLGDKFQQTIGSLQEQESSLKTWEFAKQISIKNQIYELYKKFSGYYPEGSETQTNYVKQANKLNEEIASLEQYTPIEEAYTLVMSSPDTEQLIKADGFLKKYQLEKYPKASGVISELNKTVEDLKNSFTQDFRQAMEENRANLQFDSYEFSKIVEFKKAEKAIYERFIKYYPESLQPKEYAKKIETLSKEIPELEGSDYINFERLYRELLDKGEHAEKLQSALNIQQTYNKENLPYASSNVWTDLTNVIAQCVSDIYESYRQEIDQYRDIGSLHERLQNCDKRNKIASKYLDLLPTDTKEYRLTDKQNKNDSALLPKLQLWSKFEEEFNQLSSDNNNGKATISACDEFLNEYNNAKKFEGYDSYNSSIKEVQSIKKTLIEIEEIQRLCKNFDEFERDYNSNNQQYRKTFGDIKKWKNDLNKYKTNPDINERIGKLSEIEKKNNNNWEEAECDKFRNAEQAFNNFPSIEKISTVIQAAKNYLDEQDSPKIHGNEILRQKQAYEAFQLALRNNITITLNSYSVSGTGFNNWFNGNNLDFNFSLGGNTQSIQLRGVSGSGFGLNRDVKMPLNNASTMSFELVNIDWRASGAHDSDSVNIMDEIWAGKNSFQKTCSFSHEGTASATITVSNLPTPPKSLLLGNNQVQKSESESEDDDLIQLPSLDF